MPSVTRFEDSTATPAVRGFLHTPDTLTAHGLVLTHGAGSNANAPLLIAVADAFTAAGIAVLRCDLPFRQARPQGSPSPAMADKDREGLARAVRLMRARFKVKVFLGGHSYGGRQSTIVAAEVPDLAAGLLLFSYPLHAPGKPAGERSAHFTRLIMPSMFVHGTRDAFGSIEEMSTTLSLIAGRHQLVIIEGSGHDLGGKGQTGNVAQTVLDAFVQFVKLVP
jgi:hypothetical protein